MVQGEGRGEMKYFFRSMTDDKLHWTRAKFIGWTFGGLLNTRYAIFERKADNLLIPGYLLARETREALTNATK